MSSLLRKRDRLTLAVLHPTFALTGIFHAIGGPLLPSVAATFHLNDSQSGVLFLCYFVGNALGALVCVGFYARIITAGFLLAACCSFGITAAHGFALQSSFFALGLGIGAAMSAVSMVAGKMFADRSAAPLTFLNFSWSIGALLAPLIAARILVHHTYQSAYLVLACAAIVATLVCAVFLREPEAAAAPVHSTPQRSALGWILVFAFLVFLEVGIENSTATWLATFALRTAQAGAAVAAASSSLYWCGFLASRGVSSYLLLRVKDLAFLRTAVVVALVAACALLGFENVYVRDAAMFVLGAALGPVFPLLLAQFFARIRNTADSRWVLATSGFGGSVLPWVIGQVSAHAHSLRLGLAVVPAALLVIVGILPLLSRTPVEAAA